MSARLDDVGERLARALRGPAAIESQRLFRMARPLLAMAGWRASIEATALPALIALLRADGASSDPAAARTRLDAAIDELERNVLAVERVAIVRRRAPVAHALWLRRVLGLLDLAESAIELAAAGRPDASRARAAARADDGALFPPLVPLRPEQTALDVPLSDHPDVDDARLVDLELAAIDHLMAAARAETIVLGRKRRLLVAARQRLLEAAAALPLAREGVRERTRYLAREITRIDRLEAAGLDADVSLVHQARQALVRRDPDRVVAALSALDAGALAAVDLAVSARTGVALARIHGRGGGASPLARSARQVLGEAAEVVASAVDDARGGALHQLSLGGVPSDRLAAESFLDYLPDGSERALLRAALAADGLFEVGGALSPVRIAEERRVLRMVRHPTQDLQLMPAEDVHDLRDAVIGDPRSVLLDLATGRLFTRRFVEEVVQRRTRVVMRGEVRVYVLDGSGSMRGPRARVRDAILVAELSTLMGRLADPGDTRCTLFFRYFDEELGRVTRVDTIAGARDAIREIVGTERSGGTDIQRALMASLEQIAEARALDAELARAQIVLVTDGEAAVDEPAIVAARDALGGLPIGVSVIALGEENPALRGLVARQRAKGEAAFYHFLDDAELREITQDDLAGQIAIHAPDRWAALARDPDALARVLDDEVGGLFDELEQIERERDVAAMERLEEEAQARREVGLPDEHDGGDGERARLEASRRDRVALAARYARWFPEPSAAASPSPLPKAKTQERDDVDAACCALASVAEVVALLGGSPAARQADAIDLLERLLPDARLTPTRYRAVLRDYPDALAPSLRAVRAAVAGPPP
ncbi:MAG: VWA domain-containing protein [Labilithrix sp.]|nr:VWA domain-containing protein [Labilithrix sp.]